MNCNVCSKYFSGIIPYNQHIESDKHKKKVATFGLLNNANTEQSKNENKPASVFNPMFCSACEISFDSFMLFQSHSLTLEHVNNVRKLHNGLVDTLKLDADSSTSMNNTIMHSLREKSVQPQDETDYILPPMQHYETPHLASFTECKICQKQFSGPEPYKQHIVSAAHKKKVEMENYKSNTNQNAFNGFECIPCKKTFSGAVPMEQHMVSDVHRKKLKQLQLLEQLGSDKEIEHPSEMECDSNNVKTDADNFKNLNVKYPWFCNTCLIQCSGLISYKQHLDGEAHMKNLRREEILKYTSTSQVKSGDDRITQVSTSSIMEQTFASPLLNIGIKNHLDMDSDLILPEALQKLAVISPADVNVKEFHPDVKIDFDNCPNEQNKDMKTDVGSLLEKEQSGDTADAKSNMLIDTDLDFFQKAQHDEDDNHVSMYESAVEFQKVQLNEDDNQLSMYESTVEFQGNDVYEECKLCEIKLRNKNEALSHFESYGHFMKKYRS